MRRLSSLIILALLSLELLAQQSPHGKNVTNCGDCHTTEGWKIRKGSMNFNHDTTSFPLVGQHRQVDCRGCHSNLVFSGTERECKDCHMDMHEQTLGFDCGRCHTPDSWIVANITQVHQLSRFPLLGPHLTADCYSCHPSASLLRFEPLGVECYDCHKEDYQATTNPNHVSANFSTDCSECHFMTSFTWTGGNFNHSFFPLTEGHAISDCFRCHTQGKPYTDISAECVYCHQTDYNNTTNPNHTNAGFSTDCSLCHTTRPGWKPADYREHDALFPIYSGAHNGEWSSCTDCHTTGNYAEFSCIDCHEHNQGSTDEEHNEVGGYVYNSMACYECHPTGSAEGGFNHNNSAFPLTGAHIEVSCSDCHSNGFSGTPTECFACHEPDYNQSVNPAHIPLDIPTTCEDCHTTNPGWQPATFGIHNNYYELLGAHAGIADNCYTCHQGDYNNTPNTCVGCHQADYDQTTDPNHVAAQFSTDCITCHSQNAWTPSTFDHDGQFFPIYSGKHLGTWNQCMDCHTNPSDYSVFTCVTCHQEGPTGEEHQGVGGYSYDSPSCFECHPDGSSEGSFNHDNSNFPLTGAHLTVNCLDCHSSGYTGTPTQCFACHETDFNESTNPDHVTLALPNDCENCHTTNPGWQPATFSIHSDYYELVGAHAAISNDCFTCHQGNYNNTPNTCAGCHINDYNETTDPDHQTAQFPTECVDCHSQTAWVPSTFDHDGQYFPIYSGHHAGTWNECAECHDNPGDYGIFNCLTCHEQGQTGEDHQGVGGYTYSSPACYECHPTGSAEGSFNHDNSNFPLTGAHLTVDCMDCHSSGYSGTPTECFACHESDFNQSTNPDHVTLAIPNDCANCHTTNPGWEPALFPIHDNYYPLIGEHIPIANDCYACHAGDYNNTPSACEGCHMDNYNGTTNPDHDAIGIPTDCETCHTPSPNWQPASFPIHDQYWPLTGAHLNIASDCYVCHQGDYNNTPNTCAGCHMEDYNQTTDPNHVAAQFPTDCELCHTTIAWVPSTFDHDGQYFPIYSGSHQNAWTTCSDCHPNPADYGVFTCTTCHTQGETDEDHSEVSGYVYESNACYACHPTGQSGGGFIRRYRPN